ncbi:hypothetical protein, partial [Bacteroides fragilis]|uniref:hypothetical protein n=1 Tax=Bacteroides fragilis TaxID=817 RepID=UPI0022AB354B
VKFGRKGKRKVYSQPVRNVKRCIVISGKVKAPCFSRKEVSIFRKCLLLSGEMLTSFEEKQRSFVSHLLLPVFRSGVNPYISLVASEWRTLRKR